MPRVRDHAEDLACLTLAALVAGVCALLTGDVWRIAFAVASGFCGGALTMALRVIAQDARATRGGDV